MCGVPPRRSQMLALQFARPAPPDPEVPEVHYDPIRQINVFADGRPAVSDLSWLRSSMTTTSTAGSKTHFDD
jgi:putative ATP-grasp target RiPP